MQFRFREYDEEHESYKLLTYIDVEDYDTMFKTLSFMADHKCAGSVELNLESLVETMGDGYDVDRVALCIDKNYGREDSLIPHFVVDLVEAY